MIQGKVPFSWVTSHLSYNFVVKVLVIKCSLGASSLGLRGELRVRIRPCLLDANSVFTSGARLCLRWL